MKDNLSNQICVRLSEQTMNELRWIAYENNTHYGKIVRQWIKEEILRERQKIYSRQSNSPASNRK